MRHLSLPYLMLRIAFIMSMLLVLFSCSSGNKVVSIISGNTVELSSGDIVRLLNVEDTPENFNYLSSNVLMRRVTVVEKYRDISEFSSVIVGNIYTTDSRCVNEQIGYSFINEDNEQQQSASSTISDIGHEHIHVSSPSESISPSSLFENISPAVFKIYTSTNSKSLQGSGFFVSGKGIAVSNYHVFQGTIIGYECIVLSSGEECNISKVYYKSEEEDVIIFKVNVNHSVKHIPLSSRTPNIGEKIYTIGSPLGLDNTFSSGEISQIRDGGALLQISAPIDHGSSGGVLLNSMGEAVGITTAGIEGSNANLNFAINIQIIRPRLNKILTDE